MYRHTHRERDYEIVFSGATRIHHVENQTVTLLGDYESIFVSTRNIQKIETFNSCSARCAFTKNTNQSIVLGKNSVSTCIQLTQNGAYGKANMKAMVNQKCVQLQVLQHDTQWTAILSLSLSLSLSY